MTIHPAKKPRKTPKAAPKRLQRTRVKPVNATRRKSTFARAYGSTARVEWVKARPCIVDACGTVPSENVHVKTGGAGRKADAQWIVPMCADHHAGLHRFGVKTFEAAYEVDLLDVARQTDEEWCYLSGGTTA